MEAVPAANPSIPSVRFAPLETAVTIKMLIMILTITLMAKGLIMKLQYYQVKRKGGGGRKEKIDLFKMLKLMKYYQ